jgi:hypothetical protein
MCYTISTRRRRLDPAPDTFIPFHLTLVQNIRRDPFEQAIGVDQKSAMSIAQNLTQVMEAITAGRGNASD